MACQKGKVTTKPPGEPPPSKPKTRQQDLVDPSHIVEGCRSRTPSSRLLQSSDAKPVSKPATGSETEPGPVTTAALSTILEEQESQIETDQEIDADNKDLYVDHPSVSSDKDIFSGLEPLDIELPAPSDQTSKARVARKVGKGASKAAVALPHTIKFSIPSRFGLKQLIWHTHHPGFDTSCEVLSPCYAYQTQSGQALFALHTDNDWEALKDEWRKWAAKWGEDTCIEIVTGPKEAVAAHAASSKGKAKPAVSPFLLDNAAIESESVAKLGAADMARSVQFQEELAKLREAWSCEQHPKSICMAHALRGHHKIGGTRGVDINTPPKIEYFKFFHTQDGSSSPASHHSRPKRGRSPSSSDRVASLDDNARLPVDNSPTPTIREWITHLEMQRLMYNRWDLLRQKFAEEESMDMLISSIARLSLVNLKVGYSLKMVDAVFILEQLEVVGKRYGFVVGAEDDDRQRSKKARY
ncbi:hypothetical protein JB92DRAFT_3191317 [Gautieria morchelliformis]|nr:hypothetical protein JB92DRAFT_3191317 [Gautieria morchelliformis]